MSAYRISLTLELNANDPLAAAKFARHAARGLEGEQRGSTRITHAWIDQEARPVREVWCEEAGCPVDECVACREKR